MHTSFGAIAADPQIIPGVHHHCDEWCDYCGVRRRCLAFRCEAEFRRAHRRRDDEETFASIDEVVQFTREVSAAEGLPTRELDALLGTAPGESETAASDPLERVAWQYAVGAVALLGPAALVGAGGGARPRGPEPREVIAWYHLRIYGRVFRACAARARPERASYEDEAVGSAKVALVGVRRSREAWASLEGADRARVTSVVALLDAIERGVDERFPEARAYVRVGLDVPVS